MASVGVVIVNYRTSDLTRDCLHSLAPEVRSLPDCRVVVVDGGSGDGSAERLIEALRENGWSDWAEVLALAENRGFAAGNNAAVKLLLKSTRPPDYVLLLNPDTVVRPGAIAALIEFLETHPEAGIAGSRLENVDGTPQRSAFRFPGLASEFEAAVKLGLVSRLLKHALVAPPVRDACHPADWVSGASLMIRREVLESVGLLDEGYFLYYEETDLCLRARRAGWECWYVPGSRVVHLVGQSTGMNDSTKPLQRIPTYWLQSRQRFFDKWYGSDYRLLCDAVWALGYLSWRIRRRLQGKPDRDPPALLRDFVAFSLRPHA
jgi:N-acetylglucosaminyl-diphospho-decaprenol L-rhamnosyltransferase